MNHIRSIKIILVASISLFACLVAVNNITDYGSNFAFVQHVMSMDTTFEGNKLKYRAIESPFLHNAFYWLIIMSEVGVCILCALGAWKMWQATSSDKAQFNRSKKIANFGLTLGILLWFTGFMTIGAEWFAMWQSPTWNGQSAAFMFISILFFVLIFNNQDEQES